MACNKPKIPSEETRRRKQDSGTFRVMLAITNLSCFAVRLGLRWVCVAWQASFVAA